MADDEAEKNRRKSVAPLPAHAKLTNSEIANLLSSVIKMSTSNVSKRLVCRVGLGISFSPFLENHAEQLLVAAADRESKGRFGEPEQQLPDGCVGH